MSPNSFVASLSDAGIKRILESVEPLFDLSPDPTALTRMSDGRILWVNQAFLQLTGKSKNDVLEKSTIEVGIWPDANERQRMRDALQRDGRLENFEVRMVGGDRRPRDVLFSSRIIPGPGEGGDFVFSTARDVTEIRQIQAELKNSQGNYRNLVDYAAVPVMVHCDTEIVYANEAALRVIGARSFADLAGKTPLDLVHPEDHGAVLARMADLQRTGNPPPAHEERLLRLDGTVFTARVVGTACYFQGRPGIQVVVVDTTEQKLIEERHKAFFDECPVSLSEEDISDLLAYFDQLKTQGVTDWESFFAENPGAVAECLRRICIVGVNRATLELYGVSSKTEFLQEFPQIVGQQGLQVFIQTFSKIARGERSWTLETVHRRPDGRLIEILLTWIRMDQFAGNEKRALITVVDLSEQKKAGKAMSEARRRAEEASLAKSTFLANMSHEIRTPLNGIFGMLQVLAMTDLSSRQREMVDMALASGKSLLTVINDVLDFSKIEAGRVTVRSECFQLRELLQTVADLFKEAAREKVIQLEIVVEPDLPDTWEGDAGRLRQILMNLIGNAIKFTPQGRVTVSAVSGKSGVHFQVADTGIGIAPDKIAEVFEPFIQVENTYQRKYQGSGLGLGIVKKLVELLGGAMTVESEEGAGSRFSFFIALKPAGVGVSPQQNPFQSLGKVTANSRETRAQRKDLDILVVEDNPVNQSAMKMMLEEVGHRVTVAGSGRAALEILKQRGFDCVLMDIQMPEMDGIETTTRLKDPIEFQDRARIPVIAVTAHAIAGDRERCIRAGMSGYLAKPFALAELLALLPEKFLN